MNLNPNPWFKEVIKDKVHLALQAHGGLLDNTMTTGDVEAGIIKFPFISGRGSMFKLTGAIQPVAPSARALTTVSVTPEDFQGTEFWRVQDAYKSGPSEQAALVNLLAGAVRRKRDTLKLDALVTFEAASSGAVVTVVSNNATVPDVIHYETGRAQIASYGDADAEGSVFCLLPEMYMTQLCFYEEFAKADWVGAENAPFSKAQRIKMKTVRGTTYIVAPDEYFKDDGSTGLYTWMWHKDALGAEMPVNLENADLHQRKDLEGRPYQADVFLSGAAVGLRPELVKRFLLKKITAPVRPS